MPLRDRAPCNLHSVISDRLFEEGATVGAYDPVGKDNAKRALREEVLFGATIEDALVYADYALILTAMGRDQRI